MTLERYDYRQPGRHRIDIAPIDWTAPLDFTWPKRFPSFRRVILYKRRACHWLPAIATIDSDLHCAACLAWIADGFALNAGKRNGSLRVLLQSSVWSSERPHGHTGIQTSDLDSGGI
jgi:hypothetical protein